MNASARYIESDPIGLAGGQPSTFAYVGGNPVSYVDPRGLATAVVLSGGKCSRKIDLKFGAVAG
ncbi:RHS repeat-associated core domain-containing protein [Ralstonia pseudosolanacearum]|uniref:RHS repeat-associated core domain-containing protein n=1 Tax=Ralstonia pseudosolanacearum TaxID=1310165 RepID=UPI00296243A2|nr:RHS repeat-associated core domain-containing protein [Ralstonia pseudosolanacearum]